jgi:hypothetical protein
MNVIGTMLMTFFILLQFASITPYIFITSLFTLNATRRDTDAR